jgi:hypothetical protein
MAAPSLYPHSSANKIISSDRNPGHDFLAIFLQRRIKTGRILQSFTFQPASPMIGMWTNNRGSAPVRREHGSRSCKIMEDRLTQIRLALPLTTDVPVIEPSVFMVNAIAPQFHSVIDAVAQFDRRIKEVFQKHPDAQIFSSFPGAGPILAPRLLAAMGSDRSRFNSSLEVAEYSGIAPVTERSGKSKWVHRRFACSQFVKQSFHEFAAQSILYCNWARGYYDQKRNEGKRHHAAIRALAYRWIRILYRCWKDRTPYDQNKYLKSLQQRKPEWIQSFPSIDS